MPEALTRPLVERESDQAREKQDKTGHGHGEETVGSEFFAHSPPPIASPLESLVGKGGGNKGDPWAKTRLCRSAAREFIIEGILLARRQPSRYLGHNLNDLLHDITARISALASSGPAKSRSC